MTLLVRDEEDILDSNLRYHLAQGVDFVIAIDNGSRDGSLQILQRYADGGLLHLTREDSSDVRGMQQQWLTRAARLAATELGADWVIHADADEFWWPAAGTLKDALGAIPARYEGVNVPRADFVLVPGEEESFFERMTVRETRSGGSPKVAHRGLADIVVSGGSHRAVREHRPPDPPWQAVRLRRALNAEATDDGPADARPALPALVCAPRWPIRILHFPVRSRAHLARKMDLGLRPGGFMGGYATAQPDSSRERPGLDEVYTQLVTDPARLEAGLADDWLVRDTGLRDFLMACPDPLGSAPASPPASRRPPSSQPRAAAVAEIEADMMHALTRRQDNLTEARKRNRQRYKELARELAEARKRLRDAERRERALSGRLAQLETGIWGRARSLPARLRRRTTAGRR